MNKNTIKKFVYSSVILLGISLIVPSFANADDYTSTLNQHLNRSNYGWDISPSGNLNFGSITITVPQGSTNVYYNGYSNSNKLQIHDGRYSGGLRVTVQSTGFDPNTPNNPNDDIPASDLGVLTSNNELFDTEILKNGTSAMSTPANGTPGNDPDYISMASPVVIMDGAGNNPSCDIGRVGKYATYASFRLTIPNTSSPGHYTATITYDITEAPTGC